MTTLPVRSPRPSASAIAAPYTRRAGLMVGMMMFLVMAVSSWGLGWVAIASAMLPVILGASSAGFVEACRRGTEKTGTPVPMMAGGAVLGAVLGGLLAPLWTAAAAYLGQATLPVVASGHLLLAGMSLGAATGAASGLGVGMSKKGGDPIQAGLGAGLIGGSVAFLGLITGSFAAGITLLASWLGADAALFSSALAYAPSLVGPVGIAAIAATASFAGTLTVKGAEAREKQLALPGAADFPAYARADSVSGFHRENPIVFIE